MKKILTIVSLILFGSNLLTAQGYSVSGYMRAADSGEELLYATVLVKNAQTGVSTNEYGFYSLTLPPGTYTLVYSYVGYETKTFDVVLDKNYRIDMELEVASRIPEVIVFAKKDDANIRSTEMGTHTLDIKEAKMIPVLFGEQDILKTIQLLPGVSPSSEGNAGFFVRGGDADQNLVLLDEAPVYNASHLLGFFSVFNSDALKDVKLYKGGIPAQYGGRISSVLDVRMKNGNTKSWEASGGIGLVASRLTVEGPLVKDKGSIIVSGRRTYADLLLKAFTSDYDDTKLYFYDLNLKANYNLGNKDRLYLSGYFGRDVFGMSTFGLDWGNKTATLRWNHLFSDKLFANTSFIYSNFDYGFDIENAGTDINLSSGIYNYNLKQDYSYFINPKNSLQFGLNGIYYKFKPGTFTAVSDSSSTGIDIASQNALELAVYAENEQKISDNLTLDYGFRISSFSNIGAYDYKTYNSDDEVTSTTSYSDGKFYKTYFGFEPRFSASYLLDDKQSLKVSYNRMYQYLHLLSNSNSGTPTDIWAPSSPLIKPEIGDQVALGYFRNLKDNQYELSAEVYYKNLSNQVDYEDGAETFLNPDIEAELEFGKGHAYGIELFAKKKAGKFTGWISYTLSKSERQFNKINNGDWFSARQDRTHDISIVATYQIIPKLTVSGTWVYYTGDAVTFPAGKYELDGEIITYYTDRNADRMPDYHRMDLGLTWTMKEKKHYTSDLNFSIYNVYSRKNAFSIDFKENGNTTEAIKTSLFGIVPSVTWNFHFK